MQTLSLEELPSAGLGPTAVTIGVFDGVHLGHRALIRSTVAAARQRDLAAAVLTFDPHPAAYFSPDQVPVELCTVDYRRTLVEAEGVDALVTLRFDEDLASLDPAAYVDEILVRRLAAQLICVGHDFTFGRDRAGGPAQLRELGPQRSIEVLTVDPVCQGDRPVSSTLVRSALARAMVTQASTLLGRRHVVGGRIVRGSGLARHTGRPTLNLRLERGMLPAPGIYSGLAQLEGQVYPAAIYIRDRDAHTDDLAHVEAHLHGLEGEHYDAEASLAFLHYLRRDLIFERDEDLRNRIDLDCRRAWRDVENFAADDGGLPVLWGD